MKFGKLAIEVVDLLPTPEKVFGVLKLDLKSLLFKVLGPSMIAVGVAIGGGEWLLGPATAVKYGLGMAWIVVVSALLQTVYNVSLVRLIMYTGESPIAYLRRVPPSPKFWTAAIPVMIIVWGSWGLSRDRRIRGHSPGIHDLGQVARRRRRVVSQVLDLGDHSPLRAARLVWTEDREDFGNSELVLHGLRARDLVVCGSAAYGKARGDRRGPPR